MKHLLITVGAGAGAYFLLNMFVIKDSPEDSGFVELSPGFGIDDIVLGGGTALIAMWAAKMVR